MVGSAAAVVVAAGAFLLTDSVEGGSGTGSTATGPPPTVTPTASVAEVSTVMARVTKAMVLVTASGPSGTTQHCGIGVGQNGYVATTADALAGATAITVTTPAGRVVSATVVGTDPSSDVGVIRVRAGLPSERFADDAELHHGTPAVAVTVVPPATPGRPVTRLQPRWSWETVAAVGTPLPQGNGSGMAAIVTSRAKKLRSTDAVLVDAQGRVVGLLHEAAAPTPNQPPGPPSGPPSGQSPDRPGGPTAAFLPARLVVGVAVDLTTTGHVRHGWLGVDGTESGAGTGASAGGGTGAFAGGGTGASAGGGTGASSGNGSSGSNSSTSQPAASPQPSTGTSAASGNSEGGATVLAVRAGGPSYHRVYPGDTIVAVNGEPVRSMAELRTRLYVLEPGSPAHLLVKRNGRLLHVTVTLGRAP